MKLEQIIKDVTELNKFILTISTRGKKLDADIQIAGVSALSHHKEHGDIGAINRLYLAMPKGSRKAALSSWLLKHGGIVANTEPSKKEKPFNHTKDKVTNVTAALADSWFSHKPDQAPDQVFDLMAMVNAVIAKASKATADDKEVLHPELLTKLQALVTIPDAADQAQS